MRIDCSGSGQGTPIWSLAILQIKAVEIRLTVKSHSFCKLHGMLRTEDADFAQIATRMKCPNFIRSIGERLNYHVDHA